MTLLNKLKKINPNKTVIFFISLIILMKIYLLIINPINEGSNVYITNAFLFFNLKNFLYDASSFNDWNHIGTPVYYVYKLMDLASFGLLSNNYEFFKISSHILIIFLYSVSILIFVKLLKDIVELKYIIISLIFFFSSFAQIQSLESIDPHSFQGPLVLVLTSIFISIFSREENQVKLKDVIFLCLIFCLATSVKTSFLPFCISFYISICFFFFQQKKFIKYFIILNISILIIVLLLNLPIAGRLPEIIYNVLFSRSDTSFDTFNILNLIKTFLEVASRENILYLILIIINFFLFTYFLIIKNFINIINKKNKKMKNTNLIFAILIFSSYIYLSLSAAEDYLNFSENISGILFRHSYIYSIFIIFIFISFKIKNKFLEKVYILFTFVVFLSSIIFYIGERNIRNNDLIYKEKLFNNFLKKNISPGSKIAIFNNSVGYGFANENNFYRSINLISNDKFANDAYSRYPNIRYIRLHDYLDNYDFKKNIQNKKLNTKAKIIFEEIDLFLKKNLNNNFYKFFSYKSLKLTGNYLIHDRINNRSNDLFLKKDDELIHYAIFNNSELFNFYKILPEQFIKLVNLEYKISYFKSFLILNDKWYLVKFSE